MFGRLATFAVYYCPQFHWPSSNYLFHTKSHTKLLKSSHKNTTRLFQQLPK